MKWTALAERIRLLLQPGLRSAAERAAAIRGVPLKVLLGAPGMHRRMQRAAEARIATVGLTAASGMNPGDRRALYYLMRYLRPQRVLEIGTQAGASAIHLAAGLADAHSGPTVRRLLTVDIKDVNHAERAAWRDFKLPQSPGDAMRKLGYDELVEFRVGRSLELPADGRRGLRSHLSRRRPPLQDGPGGNPRGARAAQARRAGAAARLLPGIEAALVGRQSDRWPAAGGGGVAGAARRSRRCP